MLLPWLERLDRLQRSLGFKIAASAIVTIVCIGWVGWYAVSVASRASAEDLATNEAVAASAEAPAPEGQDPQLAAEMARQAGAVQAGRRAIQDLLAFRSDPTSVAVGGAIGWGVLVLIIWMGLGLTYLGIACLVGLVAAPLLWFSRTITAVDFGVAGLAALIGRLTVGVASLLGVFTVLMRALQVALSGTGAVRSVARTMLIEAVRLKVSLVLIVLLVLVLAALPDALNVEEPLHQRMQAFLTLGMSGPFWIIGLLTVLFAASSVAFEQRDKQIWQTMTKPVSSWQYILGKWIGVTGLSAVLLGVSAAGVFLFAEYLRTQPARDETREAVSSGIVSEDRLALERRVLAARVTITPDPGRTSIDDTVKTRDSAEFLEIVDRYLAQNRLSDPDFATNDRVLKKVTDDLYTQYLRSYRAVPQGDETTFIFSGLSRAESSGTQLLLRYKVEAGMNDPSAIYDVAFSVNGLPPIHRKTGLGIFQTVPLAPFIIDSNVKAVLPFDSPFFGQLLAQGLGPGQQLITASDVIDKDTGTLSLGITNGIYGIDRSSGQMVVRSNPELMGFPPDGIELSYSVGSWRMNFLRAVLVLLVKLSFLAMLAITAATFLSFPVACLIAIGTFLMAEGNSFMGYSLEFYDPSDAAGKMDYFRLIVRSIAQAVNWTFKTYSDLSPAEKLADGQYLAWGLVGRGVASLCLWTLALYGLAVVIFRRRELAIYSGQ